MNHDSKQHLGFEQPQGWTKRAVERTAPMAMLLYSLVMLWFADEGHRQWRPITGVWYVAKHEPSFSDMLNTLKRLSLQQQVSKLAVSGPGLKKLHALIENMVLMTT